MLKPTHKAFATTFTTEILILNDKLQLYEIKPYEQILIIGIAGLTASLPDVDTKSYIPLRHRGITHTIWIILLLLFSCYYYPNFITFGILSGYTSHLIGDAYSKAGIAWFYPLQQYKRYSSGAMIVKNRCMLFPPLYKVGKQIGPLKASYYWYFITILLWIIHYIGKF